MVLDAATVQFVPETTTGPFWRGGLAVRTMGTTSDAEASSGPRIRKRAPISGNTIGAAAATGRPDPSTAAGTTPPAAEASAAIVSRVEAKSTPIPSDPRMENGP